MVLKRGKDEFKGHLCADGDGLKYALAMTGKSEKYSNHDITSCCDGEVCWFVVNSTPNDPKESKENDTCRSSIALAETLYLISLGFLHEMQGFGNFMKGIADLDKVIDFDEVEDTNGTPAVRVLRGTFPARNELWQRQVKVYALSGDFSMENANEEWIATRAATARIVVDKATSIPLSVDLIDVAGVSVWSLKFSNIKTDVRFEAAKFQYTPPDAKLVMDLDKLRKR